MSSEFASFILIIVFPISILLVLIIFLGYSLDKTTCTRTAQKLGYKYEYSIWTGCVLDDGKHKFLLEQLRKVD